MTSNDNDAEKRENILSTNTEPRDLNSIKTHNIISLNESQESCSGNELHLRDAGYAWVVLGAMFTTNVLTFGYIRGFGIISGAVMDEYPDASGTMAGVLMGVLSGCRNIFAPVVGTLCNKIGLRKSMFIGVALNFAGFILSSQCTTMWQLSLTLSVMIGFSHCILQCCQVVLVSQYFVKNLSLANGIRVASNPVGGIIYPSMLTALIQYYGLQSTFIILAAITSNIFICALLMRPIKVHAKIKAIEKINFILNSKLNENELEAEKQVFLQKDNESRLKYSNSVCSQVKRIYTNDAHNKSETKRKLYHHMMNQNSFLTTERPKKRLEFEFLKNIRYILYILLGTTVPLGLHFNYYLILYAKNSVGMSSYNITLLLAFEAVFDLFFRLGYGWLSNKNMFKKSHALIVCLWCSALGIVLIPLGKSLVTLMAITALCTVGGAAYVASLTVILCEEFGKEHIASTWGFIRTASGVFGFINSLLIGYILDVTGTFTIPFLVMGFALFMCGVFVGLQSIIQKCFGSRRLS